MFENAEIPVSQSLLQLASSHTENVIRLCSGLPSDNLTQKARGVLFDISYPAAPSAQEAF